MTDDQSVYNNPFAGKPLDPTGLGGGLDGSKAGAVDPTGGGLAGGLAGAASPSLSAEDLGATGAVSRALVPLAASVLQAPAGTLTKDRLVGDTASFLSSARASGLSDGHFGHVVRSAIDFLSSFDDDAPDPLLRAATGRMLANHLGAHGQVQALAGGGSDGGGSTGLGASIAGSKGDASAPLPRGDDAGAGTSAASIGRTRPSNRLWASSGDADSSLSGGQAPDLSNG